MRKVKKILLLTCAIAILGNTMSFNVFAQTTTSNNAEITIQPRAQRETLLKSYYRYYRQSDGAWVEYGYKYQTYTFLNGYNSSTKTERVPSSQIPNEIKDITNELYHITLSYSFY